MTVPAGRLISRPPKRLLIGTLVPAEVTVVSDVVLNRVLVRDPEMMLRAYVFRGRTTSGPVAAAVTVPVEYWPVMG